MSRLTRGSIQAGNGRVHRRDKLRFRGRLGAEIQRQQARQHENRDRSGLHIVQYVRAEWKMSRWWREPGSPMFAFYVSAEP